ncbi:hypothetical protein NYR97_11475 [Xanthomonas hydrangeae]|uniref:MFS transporter n=1 Tax=Xanthomonas hydrangeae TaxID=2775159 RepID=A0AAU0B7D5_9XANT|nr:hypothetical protein [Xanthomonas hydrangeae]WOB47915.1 hypothetical protein NYR97_11475 [Xanthomonas hydrangeae]
MATHSHSNIHSAAVSSNSLKNFLLLSAALTTGALAGYVGMAYLRVSAWEALLKDTWIIQGVLVAAIVALIYKLQSDIAGLAGLTSLQRIQLDEMVTVKSRRLWALFFAVALSALLPRLASAIADQTSQSRLLFAATALQVTSALLCGRLPGMWQELRRFTTALIAEKERKARQQAELDRLAKAAQKG